MDLLDLPPEIFQKIIASYVHTVGICKAWERRKVCKTFAAFISAECFGRQPMNKYVHPPAKKLFLQHLGLYLGYRIEAANGAPTLLPTLIRKVIDQFMTVTNQTSDVVRASYTQKVCDTIKYCSPTAYTLATAPTVLTCNNVASDSLDTCCLVIATAIKDNQLVDYYLSHGVSVWSTTRAFYPPITVAAVIQSVELVSQFLEQAESGLAKTKKAKAKGILAKCMAIVTTGTKGWEVAIVLTDWWYQHLPKPEPGRILQWIYRAVESCAAEFLHHILDHGITLTMKADLVRRVYQTHFRAEAQDLLAGALIDRGILDVSKFHHDARDFSGSLLALAVKESNIPLARRYLDSSLGRNGLRNRKGEYEFPLIRAVEKADDDMVKLLLEYGTDPSPALCWIRLGAIILDRETEQRFKALLSAATYDARKEWRRDR
ncbi:uncharacterized protein J4E78_003558 [Alternaria triticimaculans]|uniref:uncharacterized protein n=1 Tax=Alternaria triticimaculans TaxID=297637 RepID=UPI0020C416E2|nr:uncharacterized protein J4E78_003558 [Alternaria triticimaculans]KAI4666091.1 hypothetical protein J4E78_003558 [Alternaria triticimaculans]